ncbi:jg10152 [Pararge aegeria aegeria]|uniref:Jg10152 protein n=1 Tax=Pararge aegeria aegeria TaxID=348720 RepID=A0A8S4RB10_9NEOP|nr:jg10152 [Pararge aegeria aegeria]
MNAQERQPLEKSGEVLSSEPQNPDDDHDQSVKTETTKKKNFITPPMPMQHNTNPEVVKLRILTLYLLALARQYGILTRCA